MLITVVATPCLQSICTEKIVTAQATMMQCAGPMGAQVIPQWMADNGYAARGYRLAKWSCILGGRREGI